MKELTYESNSLSVLLLDSTSMIEDSHRPRRPPGQTLAISHLVDVDVLNDVPEPLHHVLHGLLADALPP